MNTEILKDIFDSISKPYDNFVKFVSFGQNKRWHKGIASNLKHGNLLDIGTATGDVILRGFEIKRIEEAFGLDLSLNMLNIAKKKLKSLPSYFVVGSAEDIPFKASAFDNISMSLVFRHILEKEKMLNEINRVLKPSGRFVILDTAKFIGIDIFTKILKTILKPIGFLIFGEKNWDFFIHSLENSFSAKEVINMCEKYGFRFLRKQRFVFGMVYLIVLEKI